VIDMHAADRPSFLLKIHLQRTAFSARPTRPFFSRLQLNLDQTSTTWRYGGRLNSGRNNCTNTVDRTTLSLSNLSDCMRAQRRYLSESFFQN
jgi:hypothetical protein